MRKIIILLIVTSFSGILFSQTNQNVIYGEKSDVFVKEDNTTRIFYDKDGELYADDFISDNELYQYDSSLRKYYSSNPQKFIETSKKYVLEIESFSDDNFNLLQKLLFQEYINKINSISDEFDIYILIHGFRKPIKPKNGSTSSQQDNNFLKTSIKNQYTDKDKPKFIEIYWNGMYDCCVGKRLRTNKRIFKLYENISQKNATVVGYSLRKIISEIDKEELSIITHSLGAQVGSSLLFNTYDNRIDNKYQNLKTPNQNKLNICFIAPAMSKEPFNEYYERTTDREFKENDNYDLSILYNEQDFVLKKKWKIFGPGPRKYGKTTLGCNHRKETFKLKDKFLSDYKNSVITLYNTTIGGTHLVEHYSKSTNFVNYIKLINGE